MATFADGRTRKLRAAARSPAAGLRMKLEQRCQEIELILADVDGVLTGGQIVFNNQGIETKQFHIRDGLGIRLWQRAGYTFGLVTGRSSHIVKIRAAELGIEIVRQTAEDKLPVAQEILSAIGPRAAPGVLHRRRPARPAGDARVGLGVAVADACAEVRAGGPLRDQLRGGEGAVRETIEMILKAQRRWDDLIQKYTT